MSETTEAERIEAQAADWLIINEGDCADQQRAAFDRWLNTDLRHEVAYVRLQEAWQKANKLQVLRPPHGIVRDPPLFVDRPPTRARRRWLVTIAASAVFVIAAVLLGTFFPDVNVKEYSSGPGIVTNTVLPDGSVVQLNESSEIRVRFGSKQREVELIRGEANFQVAHESQRPFDVRAGSYTARAVGTAFTVSRLPGDELKVIVTEGKVAIHRNGETTLKDRWSDESSSPGSEAAPPVRTLDAGEMARFDGGALTVSELDTQALKEAVSWTKGRLWFEREAVANVVAQFNRNNSRQIEIMDEDLASAKIGGGFEATDPESFLSALSRTLPARVDSSDPRVWRVYTTHPGSDARSAY